MEGEDIVQETVDEVTRGCFGSLVFFISSLVTAAIITTLLLKIRI